MLQIILQLGSYVTVPANDHSPYARAELDSYGWYKRLQIRFGAALFYLTIRLIGSTIRFETEGMEHFAEVQAAGHVPIYAFWHDRIFLGTYFFRDKGIVVITSQSFDGEYIARFIQKFGYGAIRGSSSRGGVKALVEMVRGMRKGLPMAFTLDGPRGPRYEAKPGAILLAQKTGNPIVPFLVQPRKFWRVRSWDRLQIPRPFTRCLVTVGKPIYVTVDDSVDTTLQELQSRLMSLVVEGEKWIKGI